MELDSQTTSLAILAFPTVILFIWTLWQQFSLNKLKRNQKKLFGGKKAASLEEIILSNQDKIKSIGGDVKNLYELNQKVDYLAKKSIHKIGVVRFNPFRDIGGDQSFSVALLDEEDSGMIISSLYSRDGGRVYAKALKNGQSEKYPLTKEEERAIKTASVEKDGEETRKII